VRNLCKHRFLAVYTGCNLCEASEIWVNPGFYGEWVSEVGS
jgi:hypothetical protein